MVVYENECCGPCPMGCIGIACSNRNVPHYYCDECGEEASELFSDGQSGDLCEACATEYMNSIISEMGFWEMADLLEFSEVSN